MFICLTLHPAVLVKVKFPNKAGPGRQHPTSPTCFTLLRAVVSVAMNSGQMSYRLTDEAHDGADNQLHRPIYA